MHKISLWLVGLAIVVGFTEMVQSQECPCPTGPFTWFGESKERYADVWDEYPSGEFSAYGPGNNLAACSGPFCNYSCRAEGIIFSTEITWVNVWQSNRADLASRLLAIHSPAIAEIDRLNPDADASPLVTFGYTTCEGLGFQGRFWEFDTAVSQRLDQANPAPNVVTHAWDAMVFDMEATYSAMYARAWDIMLSGGYRFAQYEEGATLRRDVTQLASVKTRYIGNGLTGGLVVRRQVASHFSLIATPRFSFLFGGETISPSSGLALPSQTLGSGFDMRYILEAKLGASYEIPLCGGGVCFARGGYEVQYWNDFVPAIDNQPRAASTVLGGFFIALGLQR